ncbi:MAG TPA: class I tRNA ligase family protein, partial [Nitrospira sp.]|nr:class I tRNA ligase family protein [Nitrospira sp.]
NVIDPLHVMEQFGTDALRFTMAAMASPGRDVKLAEERIEGYRNFTNKIWNAARFLLMHLDGERAEVPAAQRSFPDRWILSRLNAAIGTVTQELEQYRFDRASSALYQFIWHEYCDWYLELIKPALKDQASEQAKTTRQTLAETFETMMRLLHPFMPFISEEIWQTLPHEGDSIVRQPFPVAQPEWNSHDAEGLFALLDRSVSTMRMGRSLLNYPPAKVLEFHVFGPDMSNSDPLDSLRDHIAHLVRGSVHVHEAWPAQRTLRLVTDGLSVGVNVEGDVELQKVLARIKKQLEDGKKEAERLEGKLGNKEFVAKAPPEVVVEQRQRLSTLYKDQAILESSDAQIRSMLAELGP